MSRRNPLNDRYITDRDKQGVSRRSAASAKPKTRAGESTTGQESAEAKAAKAKMSRKERKEAEELEFSQLGPRAREKRMREQYRKWDVWRRRMVILAFILMFVALAYPYSVMPEDYNMVLGIILWVLPFASIGAGIYISYAKQRPIGRVLGIEYGREGREAKQSKQQKIRNEQRIEYTKQERRVEERVREKEEKVEEREKRRAENKAAEAARQEQFKAAGQAKNKKKG